MKQNTAELAHDLRMPVQLILSCAQMLEMELKPGSNADNYLKLLMQNTCRLQSMLTDVLDADTCPALQADACPGICDAVAVARMACLCTRPYADQRGVALVFSANASGFRMPVDREKLERILQNLISNALKFTPPGGSVQVAAQVMGDAVEFRVSDTGCGIPSRDCDRIFHRGVTTGGHGYGLHIVKQFAEAMGGSVDVQSRPGCGSCFTVRLPVRGSESSAS